MIIGSGLIAKAFAGRTQGIAAGACIYAAGISNSSCQDEREFERERNRLLSAMQDAGSASRFVYFSTCSIADPLAQGSLYVRHKVAMESLVSAFPNYLIFRLPQLAGVTPNPHTLLNHLFSRIIRSERFELWRGTYRNIIDVDDVVRIAVDLMNSESANRETINIACTHSENMVDIVAAMEQVLGCKAVFDSVERHAGYAIDTQRIGPALQRCGLAFPAGYLRDVMQKYYGQYARQRH